MPLHRLCSIYDGMSVKPYSIDHVARFLERDLREGSSDFDLNPEIRASWPAPVELRPAAVVVPLIQRENGVNVILTKRASHLKHHPGQIAFPGGKVDEGDLDVTDAALREADEEIGLSRENVEILGEMQTHETVTHFRITPVIGHVLRNFSPRPHAGEVEEVFEVPLAYVGDPANFAIEGRFWGSKRRLYFVVPWGPYYIWGATARILRNLAEGLSK